MNDAALLAVVLVAFTLVAAFVGLDLFGARRQNRLRQERRKLWVRQSMILDALLNSFWKLRKTKRLTDQRQGESIEE